MLRLCFALPAFLWSALLDTEDPPTEDPPTEDPPADDQNFKVYKTKEEHEADFGPTRIEGRTVGQTTERDAWLTALGVKDQDEAKTLIAAQRQQRRDNESAIEKAEREKAEAETRAQQAEADRDTERAQREESTKRIAIERAITEKGIRSDRVEDGVDYIVRTKDLMDTVVLDENQKVSGQGDAAEAVKAKYPEWFGAGKQDKTVDSTVGDRGGSGGGGAGGDDKPSSRFIQRRLSRKART